MRARKSVHPLLLEPTYWRPRLQALCNQRPGLLLTPRPDLSGGGRDVVEFRVRAHDGERLWGLIGRPEWHGGDRPVRVRSVPTFQRPQVDRELVCGGTAEVVFQEPAGRRLEDRVLDVLRICRVAKATKGVDGSQISLDHGPKGSADEARADAFLIAELLLSSSILR